MVIQRWQSVFLLIAAIMMGVFTFVSLGQVQLTDYTLNFTTCGFYYEGIASDGAPTGCYSHTIGLFVISLISIIVPAAAIFMFKNTGLQKLMCGFEMVLLVAICGVGGYLGYYRIDGGEVSWSSIIIAPLIAFVATVMAYNRISSDERKLRAADRLR